MTMWQNENDSERLRDDTEQPVPADGLTPAPDDVPTAEPQARAGEDTAPLDFARPVEPEATVADEATTANPVAATTAGPVAGQSEDPFSAYRRPPEQPSESDTG